MTILDMAELRSLLSLPLAALALAACASPPTSTASPPTPAPASAKAQPASALASSATSAKAPVFAHGVVAIQTKSGAVSLNVEIADDETKREYGLMNRRSMSADTGMVFVFEPPAEAKRIGFWMKDTLIPLSIAFVEPSLTIEALQDMQPLDQEIHYAPRDYAYAIEANRGFFTGHGVAVGDRVSIQRS